MKLSFWRGVYGVADLIHPPLERDSVERREGQAGKHLEAAADHGIELIEERGALGRRTFEVGRIGQWPCCAHESLAEIGAHLALRRVAEGNDEIHARRVGPSKLVPRFGAQPRYVVAEVSQPVDDFRHRLAGRLGASRVSVEPASAELRQ